MIAGISRKVVAITFVAAVILARLLPWLPWDWRASGTAGPVRFNFLLTFGIVALGLIFAWLYFAKP